MYFKSLYCTIFMRMIIRQEQEADYKHVFDIHRHAFGRDDEAKLVELLRSDNTFIPELSLVAEDDLQLIGHILFTRISITDEEQKYESLALAPVAVRPGYQKRGTGSRLITAGLDIARSLGFNSVIVLGHEHYYSRFGFQPASKWNISAPFEVPDPAFMALELKEGHLQNVAGTVQYPEAFNV